jgi:hypothetical protein
MTLGKHKINVKVVDLIKGNEGPPPKFDPPREGVFDIYKITPLGTTQENL